MYCCCMSLQTSILLLTQCSGWFRRQYIYIYLIPADGINQWAALFFYRFCFSHLFLDIYVVSNSAFYVIAIRQYTSYHASVWPEKQVTFISWYKGQTGLILPLRVVRTYQGTRNQVKKQYLPGMILYYTCDTYIPGIEEEQYLWYQVLYVWYVSYT